MKKILVVEDERSLRNILDKKLSKSGFSTYTARNGEEGLRLALEYQPDLILLDVAMPVMDGVEMLKLLRQNPWGATVPIIILTNLSDAKKLEEAMTYNTTQYLIKSEWKLEEVIKKIRAYLSTGSPVS